MAALNEKLRVVVVGGVAGGASAAARVKRLNENADVVVFEKGSDVSFSNCGLPLLSERHGGGQRGPHHDDPGGLPEEA